MLVNFQTFIDLLDLSSVLLPHMVQLIYVVTNFRYEKQNIQSFFNDVLYVVRCMKQLANVHFFFLKKPKQKCFYFRMLRENCIFTIYATFYAALSRKISRITQVTMMRANDGIKNHFNLTEPHKANTQKS